MYKDILKKKVMYLLLCLFHLGKFMFSIFTNTRIIMVNYLKLMIRSLQC